MPTQEGDGTELDSSLQSQWGPPLEAPPTSGAPRRQNPAKRLIPPRPALPLGPPQGGNVSGAAGAEAPDSLGALQIPSWTKRPRHNETQGYGGEQEYSESAVLPNSLRRGVRMSTPFAAMSGN